MSADTINTLLIGGGGREHALARVIAQSPRLGTLHATHASNPGIAALAAQVDVPARTEELYRLNQYCDREDIGLVVIGPEDPLAQGWGDALRINKKTGRERLVFGPGAEGAKLEADKAYAKHFMRAASIPTAEGKVFRDSAHAIEFLRTRDEPYVVKATGLAKGKGVIVPETMEQAEAAIRSILDDKAFGDAGSEILLEERLRGVEVSVLAITDGSSVYILPPCQDHKRLLDNDKGPNTGGMGALCPSGTIDEPTMRQIESEVFIPLLDAMRRDEIEFRGVLYAGLMLTHGGPKVLEFNVRFGDPECQPLMARLESDAIDMLEATASGRIDEADIRFSDQAAVCVVLASEGYPEAPRTGVAIRGVEDAASMPGVVITHAGTRMQEGELVTSGGRVLGVTGLGDTIEAARERAYEACSRISFAGMQYRHDIARGVHADA